jgi:hypothetical protein
MEERPMLGREHQTGMLTEVSKLIWGPPNARRAPGPDGGRGVPADGRDRAPLRAGSPERAALGSPAQVADSGARLR